MRIDIGDGGHTEAEEFVLRILGNDAGVADTIKLNASRVHQNSNRVFQLGFFQEATLAQKGGCGIAQYFFDHAAHVVIGVQFFMNVWHTFMTDAGRQSEFELRQAFVTQATAETDYSRLTNGGTLGDFGHCGMNEPFRLGQRRFGNFAFCAGEIGQ